MNSSTRSRLGFSWVGLAVFLGFAMPRAEAGMNVVTSPPPTSISEINFPNCGSEVCIGTYIDDDVRKLIGRIDYRRVNTPHIGNRKRLRGWGRGDRHPGFGRHRAQRQKSPQADQAKSDAGKECAVHGFFVPVRREVKGVALSPPGM